MRQRRLHNYGDFISVIILMGETYSLIILMGGNLLFVSVVIIREAVDCIININ